MAASEITCFRSLMERSVSSLACKKCSIIMCVMCLRESSVAEYKRPEVTSFNADVLNSSTTKLISQVRTNILLMIFGACFPVAFPELPVRLNFVLSEFVNQMRSSHTEVFLAKIVLKICRKFTGEHPCRSAISIKLQSNFIENTLRHGCCSVNMLHIFRTPFLKNTSGQLFLSN